MIAVEGGSQEPLTTKEKGKEENWLTCETQDPAIAVYNWF